MNEPFRATIELLDNVCCGKITVAEFQQRLEPSLYSIPIAPSLTEDKIREFANRLELIVFTKTIGQQSAEAAKLASEIKKYLTKT